MKDPQKKILFISPVNHNFFRYREHELPIHLSNKGYQCIYLDPVKHRKNNSPRLFETVENNWTKEVQIITRNSRIRKSPLALISESIDNVRQIKHFQPDIVIASDHLMSLQACRYCYKKKIRFIFDITDDWAKLDRNIITRNYWKLFVKPTLRKKASVIVSSSHKQSEYFKKRKNSVIVIPNGKSTDFIKEAQKNINSDTNNTVNYIGNLRNGYDYNLLFEVFRQLPDYQLNIHGSGELFDKLRSKINSVPNISFHGNVDYKDVPGLIAKSAFGIIPLKMSKMNDSTCPIKLFDYWSAKKVVLATPTKELKIIGKDCILFARTIHEFIEKIKYIEHNKKQVDNCAEGGYKKVLEEYNYDVITSKFEELF